MNYFVSLELMDNTIWSMALLKRIHFFLCRALPVIAACLFCLCLPVFAFADDTAVPDGNTGDLIITEVMIKNHAVVQDQEGDFPDWIELCNNSGADLDLTGWSLTDRQGKDGLVFPSYLLPADAYFVVFASGKDRPADLHAPFSLSGGEDLYLKNPEGEVVSHLICPDLPANISYAMGSDGSFTECLYPTPWYENTTSSYDALQEQMEEEGEAQEKAPELVTITRKGARTMNTLFVPAREHAEDLRSSRTAFLAVGGGACIAAALLWAGVVNLPMAGASKVIFQTAITALGLGFLFIGWKTQGSIAEALKKADAEEKRSADVLDWFRKNWTAESIDEKLLAEDPTLEGADLDFKRSAYISDLLITGQDLPDQSYADYLADKIYQELYSE